MDNFTDSAGLHPPLCTVGEQMPQDSKHSLEGLMDKIMAELVDGIRHGHFDISISGTVTRGDRVEVILRAGKNHRFLIPRESIR
jgi:hypothetical protein